MSTNLFDSAGKIALVTGASRGISEEIAKLLAKQGAYVIVSSHKLAGCEVVAEHIREVGGKIEVLVCHVGRMEDVATAFDTTRRMHGRPDILISNVAADPHFGYILGADLTAYEETVEMNIRGYLFVPAEAGEMTKTQGDGTIVSTVPASVLHSGNKQDIYSITKAAMACMMCTSAKECGSFGIYANVLLPGLTKTELVGAFFEDKATYDRWISEILLRRHVKPREIAGTVLYLMSDAASYTNGECIAVDDDMTV